MSVLDTIVVTLDGPPQGKGRPRFRVVAPKGRAPFATVYTPAETVAYEKALAWQAKAAMRGRHKFEGPVAVVMIAFFAVPASWSRKDRADALAGHIRPTGKPDGDNVLKMLDALNGLMWNDDAQVVEATVVKLYAEKAMLRVAIAPAATAMASRPELPLGE